ncbi:response regulator [Flavobacterium enshiense]|uniref:response regulator n=1 Tax=Flavobacterium enshiense TaxID=1341165 RepID=UPI00345D28D1
MKKIKNIYVIDDDAIFQFLTQKVITDTNLVKDISFFSNGLDAIKFLESVSLNKKKLPDLILLDLFMPIMDGWNFLEEFKSIQSKLSKKIPIYIVSSSIDPNDIQKSKKIEVVTDFIVKPLTKENVMHIMNNHIDRKQNKNPL